MLAIISLAVFLLSFMLGAYQCISRQIAGIILILSLVLMLIGVFSKPKYKRRELICSCELLPIIDEIYAIKTYKNKILCKYVDFEDENKVKIDVIAIKCDIVEMPEGEKPTFYLYERKLRNRWLLLSNYSNIYIGLLSIPEGSLLSE